MYCRPCILLLLLLLYWCQVMQVLFACFPLDNHKNRCYLFHGSGRWRLTRHPCPPKGMEVDNEHPGRTKSNICHRSVVDHSQFHGVRLDIPADKHICHKVCCGLCQLVHRDMHYTKSRDKQTYHLASYCSRYCMESVCLGFSLPLILPLSAKNVLLAQQKLAVLKYFVSSFMKWSVRKQFILARTSPGLTKSALICSHSDRQRKVSYVQEDKRRAKWQPFV